MSATLSSLVVRQETVALRQASCPVILSKGAVPLPYRTNPNTDLRISAPFSLDPLLFLLVLAVRKLRRTVFLLGMESVHSGWK